MSGKRQNVSGYLRKRAKQAERRREHRDKYAGQKPPADKREVRADERR